jgi:hypothetical protein
MADHWTGGPRTDSAARSFFVEAKMRAVVMIIGRVRGKKPLQMARIQSDDVVEQIVAAAPHPTLGHAILLPQASEPRNQQRVKTLAYFIARSRKQALSARKSSICCHKCHK